MSMPPDPSTRSAARSGWAICLLLVAGFVALRLPYAVWPLELHPDERHYVIGAARMMESGDYVVPRSIDGTVRLRKPPLPYYFAAGGFALFGQTALGAKALWLAAAAGTLGLTFALARAIGATALGASVAVAALGGHAIFVKSSTQHIPDGPLILGMTGALAAFAAIFAREGRRPAWLFYAGYGALAVAVLAKGLLAAVFLAVLLALRVARPLGLGPEERRHERLALALAALGCLWWFAAVALRFPQELGAAFFGDQVARKATLDAWTVAAGLRKTVTDLALPFAPFLIALFAARRWPPLGTGGTPAVALLMAWVAAVLVLFAFSDPLFERYVLPAVPAAAALIGLWAGRLAPDALGLRLSRLAPAFALVPAVTALAGAVLVARLGHVWGALALVVGALLLMAAALRAARARAALASAALLGATYPLFALALVPLYLWLVHPTPAEIFVQELAARGEEPDDVTILDTQTLANPLGLRTGRVTEYRYVYRPRQLPPDARIIVTEEADYVPELEALGYTVELIHGFPRENVDPGAALSAWRRNDLAGYRAAQGPALVVARKP